VVLYFFSSYFLRLLLTIFYGELFQLGGSGTKEDGLLSELVLTLFLS